MATVPPTGPTPRRRRPTVPLASAGLAAAMLLGSVLMAGGGARPPVAAAAHGVAPTTARVVPATAPLYVALNLDLASAQWRQVETLLARIGFPTAVADARRDLATDLADDGYRTAVDLDDFLGGELGIVVTEPAIAEALASATGGMPTGTGSAAVATPSLPAATPLPSAADEPAGGFALVLESDGPEAAFAALEEDLRDGAALDNLPVEELAHRGVDLIAVPGDEYGGGMALARVDGFVVMAESTADIEPLIDTAAGETAALGDFGPMTEVLATLNDETALFGFVNGERLGDALGGEVAAYLEAVNPGVGVAALDLHLGFALWADEPGLRLDAVALPLPGGSLPPQPANAATTLDARVPASNLFFLGGSDLGANGAIDALALAVATTVVEALGGAGAPAPSGAGFPPANADALFAGADRLLGFDLRADLLDQPVGEYALSGTNENLLLAQGVPGLVANGLFASDAREPAVVAASLRRIARLIESTGGGTVDVSTRQVAGETVFVAHPRPSDGFSTGTAQTAEFGVVDDQLVIGLGTGLDDYVDGPEEPLADDERYRRVMASLPREHNQVAYVNLRFLVDALRLARGEVGAVPVGEIVDAAPGCVDFANQAAAQAAYEADPIATGDLDRDFDDRACEDFFAGATPVASPAVVGDATALEALAVVGGMNGETYRSSAILYVAEP